MTAFFPAYLPERTMTTLPGYKQKHITMSDVNIHAEKALFVPQSRRRSLQR
jgi:hypothetical protein